MQGGQEKKLSSFTQIISCGIFVADCCACPEWSSLSDLLLGPVLNTLSQNNYGFLSRNAPSVPAYVSCWAFLCRSVAGSWRNLRFRVWGFVRLFCFRIQPRAPENRGKLSSFNNFFTKNTKKVCFPATISGFLVSIIIEYIFELFQTTESVH